MVTVIVILLLVVLAAVIYLTSQSALVPWAQTMKRLNPGVANRAEWMAPNPVVQRVKQDYLAFYDYATQTLPEGWVPYLRDLNRFLCGDMLREQRQNINARLQNDRGRVFDVLRANHRVEVRNFSADGLTCVLIDYQTERRLATYDYRSHSRIHTQDMGEVSYVFKMAFREERWKIAEYIQTLPPGSGQANWMEINLPHTVGRDQ